LAIHRLCLEGSVSVTIAVLPCRHRVTAVKSCDPGAPDIRSWNECRICALDMPCNAAGPPGKMRVKSFVIEWSNLVTQSERTPEIAAAENPCPLHERRSDSSACLIVEGSVRNACSTVACPACPAHTVTLPKPQSPPGEELNVLTVENGREYPGPSS
jgi:hypothetical protein